jgi:glyoxylase-like metal-dependent hydrolase (beta-lactamase superfamily II)
VSSGGRRVGAVEVVSLLDGIIDLDHPATESFPGASPSAWNETRTRYPAVFADDRWRLRARGTLLRSMGHVVLVDTGVGPESAPAYAWSSVRGRLPIELVAAGVEPGDVEIVVITHVHDDHLGWNVAEGTADPLFPNARYLVHRDDWELMASSDDEEDREIFAALLAPLERSGVLEISGDHRVLTDELTLVHAPGHTPGHQVVLIDSGDERAIVSADLVNHPVMLVQPGVNGTSDHEPERALATRLAFLERIEREGRLAFPTHFAEAAGRFERDGERWSWVPD